MLFLAAEAKRYFPSLPLLHSKLMVPRNWIADIYVNSYLYDPNLKRKKVRAGQKVGLRMIRYNEYYISDFVSIFLHMTYISCIFTPCFLQVHKDPRSTRNVQARLFEASFAAKLKVEFQDMEA